MPRRAYDCAHELGHHVFGHGSSIDELREDAKAQPWEDPKEFLALFASEESARDQRDAVSKMGRSGILPQCREIFQRLTRSINASISFPSSRERSMLTSSGMRNGVRALGQMSLK
jgi:hypothetical protein